MMKLGEEQAKVAQVFDSVADGYDNEVMRFFPFSADRMLRILNPRPGWRLLDIATGTGAAAVSAAQLIVPEGRVHGVDISQRMLDVAFDNVQRAGVQNIDLHEMDASELVFKSDYFDGAMCGFGIFFLPDMAAALQHWQTVMKPGAPLIFTTFANDAFSPLIGDFAEQLLKVSDIDMQAMARLDTEQSCEALLQQTGYEGIGIETVSLGYHLRTVDEWWYLVWNTALRGPLMTLPADVLAQFRAAHLESIKQYEVDDGLWLNVNVIFAKGHRPS